MRIRGVAGDALLLCLAASLAASIEGCGKPVLRVADASLGDYYTQKEFRKLSQEQRAEYCAELSRQDSSYKAELSSLQDEVDQSQARSMRMRAEGDSLFALGTAIEKRIASGSGAPPDDRRPAPAADHVVVRGESLWAISRSAAGYGRGVLWTRIYEANRGIIRDPNLIFPGQELSIPK